MFDASGAAGPHDNPLLEMLYLRAEGAITEYFYTKLLGENGMSLEAVYLKRILYNYDWVDFDGLFVV